MARRNHRPMTGRGPHGDRRPVGLAAPLLAVALLAITGGVAVWVDSEEVEQLLEAGTVDIALDEVLTPPADNLAAGDQFTHYVTVRDHSSLALGGLDMTVNYDGADLLADDLQVNVTVCAVADGQDFADCDPRFLVGGETDTLTFEALGSVQGTALPVDEALAGYQGGDVAVRVVVRLDDVSQAQAAAGSLSYAFDAVQRDGIDQT